MDERRRISVEVQYSVLMSEVGIQKSEVGIGMVECWNNGVLNG